jgi:hypothetical protein
LAGYDVANNVTNEVLGAVAGHGYVGVSVCWIVCAGGTFQNGEFDLSVGGIGFGIFGKVAGFNAFVPQKAEPWTFGACAALDIGGCVQVAKQGRHIGWGGGIAPGIGGFVGLMVNIVSVNPNGGRFFGLKW